MKKLISFIVTFISFLLLTFALPACTEGPEAQTPPGAEGSVLSGEKLTDSSCVRWIGRTEYDAEEECVYCYYTATGFTVKFTGTNLKVTFIATNTSSSVNRPYFTAGIDGQDISDGKSFSLTQQKQTVTVAENLASGTHTVTVLKRSEPENSLTSILKIETDGEWQTPDAFTGLKFQILGGSGISGHGCLGQSGEEWTTANSSSLKGFGYLTAKKFGGETQFVANSGMGLVWGYRGVANLASAYEATGLIAEYNTDGSTKAVNACGTWNHESWKPDVVIVNIGGNDWNSHISKLTAGTTARNAAETVFKQNVTSLINRIHTLYPDAYIVWTCNSVTSGNGALANSAISALAYKDKIAVVEIDNSKNGADNHADLNTQRANAQTVSDAITSKFNLEQVN
ncbi:MAG: hypothetical protein HDQ88_11940 [Clostridia bacterium]|nr:hypothetical protein [Clostridia bacterium]